MTAQEIGWHPIARPELFFPLRKYALLMLDSGNVVLGRYSQVNQCFIAMSGDAVWPVAYSFDFSRKRKVERKEKEPA